MRNDLVELVCILDRSGSMASIIDDAIGGLNTFIKEQQSLEDGVEVRTTIVMFDDKYEIAYKEVNVKEIPEFNRNSYSPRGMTALYDAIGKTVNNIGARLHNTPEHLRPGKVIFVIVTDGEENSSHEFNMHQINSMISHQRDKYSWEFIFLAANQDAMAVGRSIGVADVNTVTWQPTSGGVHQAYSAVSNYAKCGRSTIGGQSASLRSHISDDDDELS